MTLRAYTGRLPVEEVVRRPTAPKRRERATLYQIIDAGLRAVSRKKEKVPKLRQWLEENPDISPDLLQLLTSFSDFEEDWEDLESYLFDLADKIPNDLFPIPIISKQELQSIVDLLEEAGHTPAILLEVINQIFEYGPTSTYDNILKVIDDGLLIDEISLRTSGMERYHKEYQEDLDIFRQKLKIEEGAYRCPKCGSGSYSVNVMQTRSQDEAGTEFFTCASCKHQWRH